MKRRTSPRPRHLRSVPETLPAYLRPLAPTTATVHVLAPRASEVAHRPSAA